MNLDELRKEIDACDVQMVSLFEKRLQIAEQVAEYKIANQKKVYDKERELIKLAAVKELAHNEFNQKGVEELFEQLMAISRKLQYQKVAASQKEETIFTAIDTLDREAKVVFQGAKGSYSEDAMHRYFGDEVQSFHVDTFRDAMEAVTAGKAKYAVLPIENSTAGIVSEVYDLLAEFDHVIVGEQIIEIEHCLLGTKGTTLESIQTVFSHPQSLMQTEHFLREHGEWQQISMKNNAFAAQKVALEKKNTQAAIAGTYAAEAYGLEILDKGIQDIQGNSTRFIIVGKEKVYLKNASKISLCFELKHESGSLYHALSHFIYNNLNLTKIESRPVESPNWEYRFFLDLEGNTSQPSVCNALCGLREETCNLRILGNY